MMVGKKKNWGVLKCSLFNQLKHYIAMQLNWFVVNNQL